jgi:hypothetical protein
VGAAPRSPYTTALQGGFCNLVRAWGRDKHQQQSAAALTLIANRTISGGHAHERLPSKLLRSAFPSFGALRPRPIPDPKVLSPALSLERAAAPSGVATKRTAVMSALGSALLQTVRQQRHLGDRRRLLVFSNITSHPAACALVLEALKPSLEPQLEDRPVHPGLLFDVFAGLTDRPVGKVIFLIESSSLTIS